MRRQLFSLAIAGMVLAVPAPALAAPVLQPHPRAMTGILTSEGSYSFTVQKAGPRTGVINALIGAANRVTAADYPYVWGGGHAMAGVASVGARGPGFNGRRRGYDCSGAVAAVLAGGGLWPAGAAVPSDIGVIRYLRQHHEIAPGGGSGPQEVTLYDNPGVHIFMNIDGRFFGTSDGGAGGDPRGGPGWLADTATEAYNPRFRRWHFLPWVLRATTNAGFISGFQYAPVPGASVLPLGITVRVVYTPTRQGTMVAQSVTPLGEVTATGTVQAIALDASGFTISSSSGQALTFPAPAGSSLAQSLADGAVAVGDGVSVTYVNTPALTVVGVTVTSSSTTTSTSTTSTTTTPTTTTPTTTTPATTTPTTTTTTPASTAFPSSSDTGGVALGG